MLLLKLIFLSEEILFSAIALNISYYGCKFHGIAIVKLNSATNCKCSGKQNS